jgi:hypothetical protein
MFRFAVRHLLIRADQGIGIESERLHLVGTTGIATPRRDVSAHNSGVAASVTATAW